MERRTEIKGIITPIVTPMHEDESINTAALRDLAVRQIENGVHALFCSGTNGEGFILDGAEKQQTLEAVVDAAGGRVPVYAGTGCISTKETIEQSKNAAAAGADALSIVTPSFAAATQDEIYDHYMAVARAVDIPIILYNIPFCTGNAIAPATVARLQQNCPNIVGAKDSSGNFINTLQYIEATRERGAFGILCGNDGLILWTLCAGGAGCVTGSANIYPRTLASLYNCFINGDTEKAREHQDSIRSLRDCFKYGTSTLVLKTAMRLLGYDVGNCRAPFNQISDEGVAAIKQVLKENADKGMS